MFVVRKSPVSMKECKPLPSALITDTPPEPSEPRPIVAMQMLPSPSTAIESNMYLRKHPRSGNEAPEERERMNDPCALDHPPIIRSIYSIAAGSALPG